MHTRHGIKDTRISSLALRVLPTVGLLGILAAYGCGNSKPSPDTPAPAQTHENHEAMRHKENNMQLVTVPGTVTAGTETELRITPKTPVELQESHEKKMHLIVVSEDLSDFRHLHPVQDGDAYTVKTTFPHGGKFYLYADYVPAGGEQTVERLEATVQGETPAPEVYGTEKLTGSSGAYSLTLVTDGNKFTVGHMAIDGILKKDGKAIDPAGIDDYLGAKAHVVLIGMAGKDYLHVHPEVADGRYKLHTTFPTGGTYRGWIQFQIQGALYTTDYVIQVNEGNNNAEGESTHHH